MALVGRLATVSLGEVFQILDRGRKSGRLVLQLSADGLESPRSYSLWFQQGRIVAITARSSNGELLTMLRQRRWISDETISELNQHRTIDRPLGSYLKEQGTLQAEQLRLLFHAQVIQRVCSFFKFQDGQFQFDADQQAPKAEMTGLSLSIAEATLLGLRVLKDWSALQSRLPRLQSTLSKPVLARLTIQLDTAERRIWELADGILTVEQISVRLSQSREVVQQVAFRLLSIGLIEELPADSTLPKLAFDEITPTFAVSAPEPSQPQVSQSFLQNLLGFLRSKV